MQIPFAGKLLNTAASDTLHNMRLIITAAKNLRIDYPPYVCKNTLPTKYQEGRIFSQFLRNHHQYIAGVHAVAGLHADLYNLS